MPADNKTAPEQPNLWQMQFEIGQFADEFSFFHDVCVRTIFVQRTAVLVPEKEKNKQLNVAHRS